MIDETSMKFNLRQARSDLGLSLAKMAEAIGISVTALRKLEVGKTAVLNKSVYAMAEYLGTTPERLLLGYDPVDSADPSWHSEIDLNEVRESLKAFYEGKLKEKTDENAEKDLRIVKLQAEIERLEAFSKSQQSMIDFLQKHTSF